MKPPMPISLPSVNSYLALPVVRWPSHLASHEQGYGEDSRPGSALHFHPPLHLPCLPTRRRWGKDSRTRDGFTGCSLSPLLWLRRPCGAWQTGYVLTAHEQPLPWLRRLPCSILSFAWDPWSSEVGMSSCPCCRARSFLPDGSPTRSSSPAMLWPRQSLARSSPSPPTWER